MIGWKNRPRTDYIVIHCSKTHPEELDEQGRPFDFKSLETRNVEDGAFVGRYHWVIDRNGAAISLRGEDTMGNHCPGVNGVSVAICLIGGADKEGRPESNFTREQWVALRQLVDALTRKYPSAEVVGHNNVSAKATTCPSFDVKNWVAVGKHRQKGSDGQSDQTNP